jgi:hypothetical protein
MMFFSLEGCISVVFLYIDSFCISLICLCKRLEVRSHFLCYAGRCCVWTDIYHQILSSSVFYIVYVRLVL